jgi:hypothetical protein
MKAESKVVLTLVLLLLALEVGARVFEGRLSRDIQHLRTLPGQAYLLKSAPKESLRILLLGNSLARCGMDQNLLKNKLSSELGRPVILAVMHPDGSKIEEWAYGYQRYFRDTNSEPDAVLLITGRQHLTDKLKSADDMGAFYVGNEDLLPFMKGNLRSVEEASWFLAARYSTLMAHRKRVEPLVFYNLVPGYEQTAQAINRSAQAPAIAPTTTCEVFKQFAHGLKSREVRLFVASAPLPEPFDLPEPVISASAEANVTVHPSGANLKLPAERFPDQYHLDQAGAQAFTEHLLPTLIKQLKSQTY